MPLARIITEVADDCLELTMQLRARGFQVETVPPGAIPSTPADLEVHLDECAPEDVVSHMARTAADGDDLWVFVAPGALDSNSLPIRSGPISIDSALPRYSLRKMETAPRETLPMAGKIATVSPLAMSAPELKPAIGNVDVPAVLGSLAMDAQEEDLILAELREFPLLSGTTRSAVSAPAASVANANAFNANAPIKIQPIEKAGVLTRLAARVAEAKVAEAEIGIQAERVEEKREVKNIQVPETTTPERVNENVVTSKWLQAPEKSARPANLMIPVAPEPVRANIVLPAIKIVQKVKAPPVWNLQKLKLACSVAALAISAWFLIGTSRLGDAGTAKALRPQSTASTPQTSHPATATPPVQKAQDQVKPSTHVPVAAPVPRAKPNPSTGAAVASGKERSHHLSDDGIIAQDTVVFYDRKQPSPRANVTQPEPGVKHYSDHE
jgi:hypothetical protein